jgi:hypothetical protein
MKTKNGTWETAVENVACLPKPKSFQVTVLGLACMLALFGCAIETVAAGIEEVSNCDDRGCQNCVDEQAEPTSLDVSDKIARQAGIVSDRLGILCDRVNEALGDHPGAAIALNAISSAKEVFDRIASHPEFIDLKPLAIRQFLTAIGTVEALLPVLEPPGDALVGALAATQQAGLKLLRLVDRLAVDTHWVIPADVLAAGDLQFVERTTGGPWTGPSCTTECVSPPVSGCSGGLRPGAVEFSSDLKALFPQIADIAGYCCRDICADPPSGEMSIHGTGRALDLFLPLDGGDADNAAGDVIANWLIEHAEEVGVQLIIWHRWMWIADADPGSKSQPYPGLNPHINHIHVELSVQGGEGSTAWFSEN